MWLTVVGCLSCCLVRGDPIGYEVSLTIKLNSSSPSGTYIDPRLVELNGITYSGAVGGMDVYRYDQGDESKGYPINKDHYFIVLDQDNDDALLVHGPIKDHEHWLTRLPDLPDGIIVIDSLED